MIKRFFFVDHFYNLFFLKLVNKQTHTHTHTHTDGVDNAAFEETYEYGPSADETYEDVVGAPET